MQRWFSHKHVIFDCDSTLSKIEGIDELAKIAGVSEQVAQMTDAAMAGEIGLEEVYGKRLELINPTQQDIAQLNQAYKNTATEDAQQVVSTLMANQIEVYIVSGGLLEPVREFGISLGIAEKNIHAVGVNYNQLSGQWWLSGAASNSGWNPQYMDFHQSPLTLSEGKKTIIDSLLKGKSGRSLLIGDGMSDCLAASSVDQFIGYGGVVKRENVAANSTVFISSQSLVPVLALAGGEKLLSRLKIEEPELSDKIYKTLIKDTHFTDLTIKQDLTRLFESDPASS